MDDSVKFFLAVIVFLVSNSAFAYMIWRKRYAASNQQISDKKVYQLCFVFNFAGGLLVGLIIALSVLRSSEPSYFLMPLVLAPFGYWISFSIPIILTLLLIKWKMLKK